MVPVPTAAPTVRSIREYFGSRLRQWRRAAGLTQAELGRLVGYDHSQISKIESGLRWAPPGLSARCDEILGTGRELAALWPLVEDERRLAMAGVDSEPTSPPCDRCVPVDPLSVVPAVVRATSVGDPPPTINVETIGGLDALLDAYQRCDADLGGGLVIEAVEGHLRTMMGWLTSGCAPPLRTALLRLAARYGYLAGWTRFENGQHGLAMAWFERALAWGHAGGDPGLAGDVQTRMGVIARAEGDQARALACAQIARVTAGGRPWIGFLAAVLEARALAALGEHAACECRLDTAANLAGRTDPGDAPWLAGPHGEAMIAATRAACYRDLSARSGRRALATRAVDCARAAIDVTPAHMLPNRALFAARLADAHACAGEPDAAVAAAEPILLVPASARSSLVVRELRGLSRRLVPRWEDMVSVRSLAERVLRADPPA